MLMKLFAAMFCALVCFLCPEAFASEPICVVKPKAHLRQGPGPQHPVTWVVGQFMPLMKVGQKGKWLQVQDLDGTVHWIASSMVSSKLSCAVVKARIAALRRGPGRTYPTAEPKFAERYTPFLKVDRDGAWVQLQDDYRGKFWVNEDNLWMPMQRARVTF